VSPAEPQSVCVNHPRREALVQCGKCGDRICTRCMVQTPVGMRCRPCANLRRLPQYDVSYGLLARASLVGLCTSTGAWFLVSLVPYLRFFLSILVGIAVGEVMSRMSKRRSNLGLDAAAVGCVVVGLLLVESLVWKADSGLFKSLLQSQAYFLSLVIPAVIASVVAVIKLR
jgi:hypothetical protein